MCTNEAILNLEEGKASTSELRLRHAISYSWVKKREVGEPAFHHAENCLFGLDCLNPQLVSGP